VEGFWSMRKGPVARNGSALGSQPPSQQRPWPGMSPVNKWVCTSVSGFSQMLVSEVTKPSETPASAMRGAQWVQN
jgi:hypothetical protein